MNLSDSSDEDIKMQQEDGLAHSPDVHGEVAGEQTDTASDNPSGDEPEAPEARIEATTSNNQPSDPTSSLFDSAALTPDETERYLADLKTIRKGVAVFYEVGKALARIKDGKLYRLDYTTWDEFCKAELDNTTRHADRWIEGAKIIDDLREGESDMPFIDVVAEVENSVPKNEAQARQLKRLKTREERKKAWTLVQQKASERNQPITAEMIIEAVNEVSPKNVKTEPKPKSESKAKASPAKSQNDAGRVVPKPPDQLVQTQSFREEEVPPQPFEPVEDGHKQARTAAEADREWVEFNNDMLEKLALAKVRENWDLIEGTIEVMRDRNSRFSSETQSTEE